MIPRMSHTHTFWGPHPEVLADGTPLAPGDVATPNLKDPHDRHLIERGWLLEGAASDTPESPDPPKASTRRKPQED
jgi:hypothetical protein